MQSRLRNLWTIDRAAAVKVASHLVFSIRRATTWPPSPERRKTIWPLDKSFCLLKYSFINKHWNIELLFRETNSVVEKGFFKNLTVGLFFDVNLQYRSIYATFKSLAQFSFASALKMEL